MYHPYWPEGEGAYGTLNASDISGDIHTFIGGMGEIFMTTSWSLQFDKPVKIIVEYTKSTDDALSGDEVLPVEYGNPIGTIISLMGKTAPDGYLVCDGEVYSISAYKRLSAYIEEQFGDVAYFGGNGTTTFAVPDLRGEFLRGTGTATRDSGSGAEVGVHQGPTKMPYLIGDNLNLATICYKGQDEILESTQNEDKIYGHEAGVKVRVTSTCQEIELPNEQHYVFSSKPTNTAVLYCIKCV